MQIELAADVEALVTRLAGQSDQEKVTAVANKALRLFLDPPEVHRRYGELKALIREGAKAADRGEVVDADEVFDEILRELEDRAARSE